MDIPSPPAYSDFLDIQIGEGRLVVSRATANPDFSGYPDTSVSQLRAKTRLGALANLPAISAQPTDPNLLYRLTIGRLLASTGNVATP
jgi:hypothetical protein